MEVLDDFCHGFCHGFDLNLHCLCVGGLGSLWPL